MNSYEIIKNELDNLHWYVKNKHQKSKWALEKINEIHIDLFEVGELAETNIEEIESDLTEHFENKPELPEAPNWIQ